MAGTVKQIIGSFEDIGKDIARETGKVPADVVGKALESLGTTSQKSQKSSTAPTHQTPDAQEKKPVVPRQWLEELAGTNKKQKEPTVEERLAKEDQEKLEKEKKQAAKAVQMAPIQTGGSKPKRGNLYGIRQKRTAVENKNVRQD